MRNVQRGDCCQHAPGNVERAVRVGVRQQDHEFVATVARGKVGRALQRLHDCPADGGEAVVAGAMPMVVVVRLEVVDIDEQHGQRPMVPTRALPLRGADDVEVAAVVQTGQRVGDGERTQFVLKAPVLLQLLTQARIEAIEATRDPDDRPPGPARPPRAPTAASASRSAAEDGRSARGCRRRLAARRKAELAVHVEDVLPAADVRVAELHKIRAHQRQHALGLEAQLFEGKVGRVLRVNELQRSPPDARERTPSRAGSPRGSASSPFRVPASPSARVVNSVSP